MSKPSDSIELIVDQSGHCFRIDQWLSIQQPQFSRNYWTDQIKKGNVLLNNVPCLPKNKLKIKDTLTLLKECFDSPAYIEDKPQYLELDIIYEDDQIIVINKPFGLVVHPGAGNFEHTLLNGLLAYHSSAATLPRAGIVHRLDKDTTGIMVVSKTLEAYHSLVQQLQERTIKREYYALVYGHVISGGHIETQFGRHPKNRLKMAVVLSGKEAITKYSIVKQFEYFTLLNVQLETGRTHQIRVHMAHIGHPIVGDTLYGGRIKLPPKHTDNLKISLQSFTRQALHAHQLTIKHPTTEQSLTWNAPMPDDLSSLLETIEANFDNNHSKVERT